MSVTIVEAVIEGRADLAVRVVESGEYIRCVPPTASVQHRSAIGWIGPNLLLVDEDDMEELGDLLDVIAIEVWRPKVIQGGRDKSNRAEHPVE